MSHLHMTDLALKSLAKNPPPPPCQREYFDDPARGVRGLMVKHSYGGSLTWYVMHYEGGKSKLFKLGKYPVLKLAPARQAALDFLANPKKAIVEADPKAEAPKTFVQIVDKFFAIYVAKNKLRTAKVIRQRIDKHLIPTFKDYEFASIRRRDLVKVLDQVEEDHGTAMADAILGIFQAIANWHCSRDEDYKTPIGPKMKRSKTKRKRERVLDDPELKAFWAATGELGTFGAILRVLLLTGQRRSKVCSMKRTDIKDGVWHIHTEENEKPNPGLIKLPKLVIAIIEAQPRLDNQTPYLFPGARCRRPFNAFGQFAIKLDKMMHKSLPDMKPHTIHDLRRTMRTRLSRIGVEPHIAERCLGHIVGNANEKIYNQHPFYDEMSKAFAAFAAHIHELVTPPPANVVKLSGRRKQKQQQIAPANG
jgi:integrase